MCGKLDVTLRSCIMSWWTLQRVRQLYSTTMWLWMMVCRERVLRSSSMQNDPGVCGVLHEHRAPVKDFSFCSPGVALLASTRTWTCVSWIPLLQRFHVARPPLSFRPNGQDVSTITEDNRDFRRQTRKAEDIYAIRGCWSKRRLRTNPRHLFRYCYATLHVRNFRRIAAVAEAFVRCMWPERAQAMMKDLYDDGLQHPGRSTLLRARTRLDFTSMFLRRRWFNSDRWHSQPQRSAPSPS